MEVKNDTDRDVIYETTREGGPTPHIPPGWEIATVTRPICNGQGSGCVGRLPNRGNSHTLPHSAGPKFTVTFRAHGSGAHLDTERRVDGSATVTLTEVGGMLDIVVS